MIAYSKTPDQLRRNIEHLRKKLDARSISMSCDIREGSNSASLWFILYKDDKVFAVIWHGEGEDWVSFFERAERKYHEECGKVEEVSSEEELPMSNDTTSANPDDDIVEVPF